MARPKLSEEERAARRRARSRASFSDAAYTHYDPARDGYGSAREWTQAAGSEQAGPGRGQAGARRPVQAAPAVHPDLQALGLTERPESLADLKSAFRAAMKAAHPDTGGTDEQARAVIEAHKRLAASYGASR